MVRHDSLPTFGEPFAEGGFGLAAVGEELVSNDILTNSFSLKPFWKRLPGWFLSTIE